MIQLLFIEAMLFFAEAAVKKFHVYISSGKYYAKKMMITYRNVYGKKVYANSHEMSATFFIYY